MNIINPVPCWVKWSVRVIRHVWKNQWEIDGEDYRVREIATRVNGQLYG